jgi:hypothetical protein
VKFYTTSKISENIHETPEGYLVCVGVAIARTGEMVYHESETPLEGDEEGKVLVQREEDEVFRPETMASFEGKPVTITHPTDFVSPQNWNRLTKGILQNVRRGEGDQKNDLIADLLITDSVAINLVKNGLREVSCGYEADYTQMGEGRGLQTKIIGNHLALVDQGRAGSSYAINDHKGKGVMSAKMIERLKQKFGAKVVDEAMAEEKKEDKKESKDEFPDKKDDKKEESKDEMSVSMDAVLKAVKDLGDKMEAMKGKDASTQPTNSEPAHVEAKDDESAGEAGLEDRLKALETSVAAILEKLSTTDGDWKESENGDEDAEESEDDDFEESTMTGDTASRIEILAPGLKAKAGDAKIKALKAAYLTKDGKDAIHKFTGGKAPDFSDAAFINGVFVGASEILKLTRTSELSKTKQTRDNGDDASGSLTAKGVTPEELNAMNAKHWANRA